MLVSAFADSSPAQRFDLLDGIRGIAAIAVMLYHFSLYSGLHWVDGAWAAVDLFFVLSGFVIAHSYGKKILGGLSFRRFLWLRVLRLGPLYSVGLLLGFAAMVLISALGQAPHIGAADILRAFALGTLWLPDFNSLSWPFGASSAKSPLFPLNDPAWSLFFEMFVNVLFFAFVASARKTSSRTFVALSLALFLFTTLHYNQINPGWRSVSFVFAFPRVIAEFFLGTLIHQEQLHRRKLHPAFAITAVALVFSGFLSTHPDIAIANAFLGVPLVIITASGIPVAGQARTLCHELGELSYPLYVTHFPLYRLLYAGLGLGRVPAPAQVLLLAAISIGAAFALSQFDRKRRRRSVIASESRTTAFPHLPTTNSLAPESQSSPIHS